MLKRRKIGIVTIYNNVNCGSVLQAVALLTFLENNGVDVYFVKNKRNNLRTVFIEILRVLRNVVKLNFKQATDGIILPFIFRKFRKNCKYSNVKKMDICVYGSDTIWNLSGGTFKKQWRLYWGDNFSGKKIAYAPSIGPASVEMILANDKLCKCLKEFNFISVRDSVTEDVVRQALNIDFVIRTIDPTMLMTKSFYQQFIIKNVKERYILIYYFGKIPFELDSEIKKYADINDLKIISFGDSISNPDRRLSFEPYSMMTYYNFAECIVTNTFHGNVFSIIFNKQFVNIDAGKGKVNDLLSQFDLSQRTLYSHDNFMQIMHTPIEFDKVNKNLDILRNRSQNYLVSSLKECVRSIEDEKQISV